MNIDNREAVSATVTVTITMHGLGNFGPGSLYSQALHAAKIRLEDRGFAVDKIQINALESRTVK